MRIRRTQGLKRLGPVAVAMVLAGCSITGSSARSTTQDFFSAFSDGDGAKACSLVAPDSRVQVLRAIAETPGQRAAAQQGSCRDFARGLGPQRRKLFGTVIADPAPGSGGETVTARFELDPKKPVVPYSVRLHKNGDWKIVSINSGGPP